MESETRDTSLITQVSPAVHRFFGGGLYRYLVPSKHMFVCGQVVAYVGTLVIYMVATGLRTALNNQKKSIQNEPAFFVNGNIKMSILDMSFYGSYAISMVMFGRIADFLGDKNRILTSSLMFGIGLALLLYGLTGTIYVVRDWEYAFYCFEFCVLLIGGLSGGIFPVLAGIRGNWLARKDAPKTWAGKNIGLLMGLWASFAIFGSFLGCDITAYGMTFFADQVNEWWPGPFFVWTVVCTVVSVLTMILLPEDPESIGIVTLRENVLEDSLTEAVENNDIDSRFTLKLDERASMRKFPSRTSLKLDERASMRELPSRKQAYRKQNVDDMFRNVENQESLQMLFDVENDSEKQNIVVVSSDDETESLLSHKERTSVEASSDMGFMTALRIPGVIPYALAVFFMKFIVKFYESWLSTYSVGHITGGSDMEAGRLVKGFFAGGFVGCVVFGFLIDYTGRQALTVCICQMCSIPCILATSQISGSIGPVFVDGWLDDVKWWMHFAFFALSGFFIIPPYNLITNCVSLELGRHPCLKGSVKAIATVSGIINGFGGLGSVAQGILKEFFRGGADGMDVMPNELAMSSRDFTNRHRQKQDSIQWDMLFYTLAIIGAIANGIMIKLVVADRKHRLKAVVE